MASVRFEHVTKRFGDVTAVRDLSLSIDDREFLVLVGPSGCGKSTTLRMLAGLEEVSEGEVHIGERRVTDDPPRHRNIAMVFQSYALYPPHDGLRQPRVQPEEPGGPSRRDRAAGPGGGGDPGHRRAPFASPAPSFRRRTPAGGPRAGDRARAAGVPHGRAALEPGCPASRLDPGGARQAAPPPPDDVRLRDARPGRGADHGYPHRGVAQRGARTGRRCADPLRPSREPVRRFLHRKSADEPDSGRRARRRRLDSRRGGRHGPRARRQWPAI